ncbi:hypothetical protein [Catellatospora coxensis]|nr:hypothetical protein [Catellatospora coxensis]
MPVGTLSAARRRIYSALIAQPKRHWSVRTLTDALSAHACVKEAAVRDAVNLLLAQRFMEQVPYQRALTVALTAGGEQALIVALRRDTRSAEGP